MGMAASQARYLSLQARMSNVEYQGQQINQERTILSQQATALYNSLLDMQVPTPPSTSDFTKIEYSGVNNATNFTLGNIKPQGDKYIVEINTKYSGETLSKESGVRKVEKNPTTDPASYIQIVGKPAEITEPKEGGGTQLKVYPAEYLSKIYVKTRVIEPNQNQGGTTTEEAKIMCLTLEEAGKRDGVDKYYTQLSDGTFTLKESGYDYLMPEAGGALTWYLDPQANYEGWKIGGYYAYRFDDAEAAFPKPQFDWDEYKDAIENTYGTASGAPTYLDFYVYFDTTSGYAVPKFVLEKDLQSIAKDGSTIDNHYTETYEFIPNGIVNKTEAKQDCKLTFDSQGRIASIDIPKYGRNPDGTPSTEIIGYTNVPLTANTTTDTVAYDDAYNQYEYNQYLYDKKVQEINAQTEIIQAEDRSLELRLQRLDNERTALKTEMDAVEKVINENIDNSYKTFSG